jgi:hypothetical protein
LAAAQVQQQGRLEYLKEVEELQACLKVPINEEMHQARRSMRTNITSAFQS